jgi:cardiolipin synthase C
VRCAPQPETIRVDLLKSNLSAFADRFATIKAATKSLELMYYIWREDTSGIILLHEIIKAADRGVKVRIILDAINFPGAESIFIGVNQHPNIEVCLYNGFNFGFVNKFYKFFEVLLRASLLNRRMHNKCWLVDREIAICGGRNIGDEYFGNKRTANFTDLDVGMVGPVAHKFGEFFDLYWQSRHVKPLSNFRGLTPQQSAPESRAKIDDLRAKADSTPFGKLLIEGRVPHEEADNFLISEKDLIAVCDPPEKILPKKSVHPTTVEEVFGLITSAKNYICLVSPYFVPGPRGSAALKKTAKNNCVVKILTNSLAATDAIAAHSGVIKYRKSMLDCGIELYELKPSGRIRRRLGILPKSRASLHTKAIVVDCLRSYVGSFNLDPRSAVLNCEMGIVATSAPLANEILRIYTEATDPTNSWRLIFTGNRKLTWIGKTEQGKEEKYFTEPQASRSKRLTAWIFSCLPIEPLL